MLNPTSALASKPTLPPVQGAAPAPTAGGPSFAQFLTQQAAPPPPASPPQPARAAHESAPGERHDAAPPDREGASDTEQAEAQAAAAGQARRQAASRDKPGTKAPAAEGKHGVQGHDRPDRAESGTAAARGDGVSDTRDDDEGDAPTSRRTSLTPVDALGTPPLPSALDTSQAQGARAGEPEVDTDADTTAPARAGRGETRLDGRTGRAADHGAGSAADTRRQPPTQAARDAREVPQAADRGATKDAAMMSASGPSADGLKAGTGQPGAPVSGFAAVLAQALPPAGPAGELNAPVTSARVHAPLHSHAFAPEVGARVSLMAADGVQHAELQLNPADMGPVSVQIVLDGSQAQVSFHAAQADTRQALEQGLPDLAAALQGQGLTLSGGGVFQQPPQQRDAQQAADQATPAARRGDRRSSSVAGPSGHDMPAAAPRRVGLLDTFA